MGELVKAAAAMKITVRVASDMNYEEQSESLVPAIEGGEEVVERVPAFNQSSIAKHPSDDADVKHVSLSSEKDLSLPSAFKNQVMEKFIALKERQEEIKKRLMPPKKEAPVLVELYEPQLASI